ncbi:MAG: molybdopterin-binding protein [Nitrospirae bacterium]|nr:molybdopterin-binding protein [Nitrospirota bacterium]
MCEIHENNPKSNTKTISVADAVGTVLAHDITEITPGQFKGCAFRKGHIIQPEDVTHLQRLGKEHLFVLDVKPNEMHEDEAAYALANALMGEGVKIQGDPREGKINIIAKRSGLLKIDRELLHQFNMSGDIMCATLHNNTVVKEGQTVAGTRAIPLVVKKEVIECAVAIANNGHKIIEVKEIRRPKVGVVITGNEVYYGRIQDAFGPVIKKKLEEYGGEVSGIYFAPDDESYIEARLRELIDAGCDLLITTGGMSVDPDDVTRFAIRNLGASDITYGSAVLPGAMFLIAYLDSSTQPSALSAQIEEKDRQSQITHYASRVTVLGIPACGMYHKTTIFDLMLPRVLAGEKIGRKELAELGHGGLCMNCEVCRYPVCPFGKG